MTVHSEVHTNADLDSLMKALEIANQSYAAAFDVLRVALHIQPEEPVQVWRDSHKQLEDQR